jgi:WD40 repeat protein
MMVLKTKSQKLPRLAFAPDGQGLAAAGQHGAYWWRSVFDDPKPVQLGDHECRGLGFTADGAYLVYLSAGLGVCATHLAFAVPQYGPHQARDSTLSVCAATGMAVVERWTGGEMTGWRVGADGALVRAWSVNAEPGSIGSSAAFVPDGSFFVRAARDHQSRVNKYRLALHDPATGKEIGTCRGDVWVSAGPAVSPDKEWIAYANGNFLRVQSLSDERRRETAINDNTHQYTGLAFHPSGHFLAATNNDATVKLFDAKTWKLAHTFTWKIGKMRSIAFSPDGALAAAGSDTGKVVVWDVDL